MATYAELDDVRARIGGRELSSSTSPSDDEVESMLNEAEAELLSAIAALGVTSFTSSIETVFRGWIARFVAGCVRVSHAAAAGDGSNPDGDTEIKIWMDRLADFRNRSSYWVSFFASGVTPDAASNVRSYVTDNERGESIENGDFEPVITNTETF